MKSSDWGKLIARVLASYFLMVGATLSVSLLIQGDNPQRDSAAYWTVLTTGLVFVVASALLWLFADKFAPATDPSGEADQTQFGVILCCAVASYLFFEHLMQAANPIINWNRTNPDRHAEAIGTIAFHALLCAGLLLVVLRSRRIVRWLLR